MIKNVVAIVLITIIILGSFQTITYEQPLPKDYVELSEGKIAYEKYGEGNKTIILIHGSPGRKETISLVASGIENHTVYNLDMYGFGESDKRRINNFGISSSADVIKEFMDAKSIQSASILGYSWGGGVVEIFAERYPESTDKLILLAGMGIQEGEPTGSYFLENFRYLISYPFVIYYPGVYFGDVWERRGFMRSFMDNDQREIEEIMMRIDAETLVLHGDKDMVIQMWVAEKHAELIPNSELVFFDGDHMTLFSDADEINLEINRFLE